LRNPGSLQVGRYHSQFSLNPFNGWLSDRATTFLVSQENRLHAPLRGMDWKIAFDSARLNHQSASTYLRAFCPPPATRRLLLHADLCPLVEEQTAHI
jgi:hypothetical protein